MRFNDGRWGLTAERLRQVVYYDPDEGVFLRIKDERLRPATVETGDGYLQVWVDGHYYRAHRLAWLYIHGEWPSDEIDHINCLRDDNRLANLRVVTREQNAKNLTRYKPRKRANYKPISDPGERWEERLSEDQYEIARLTGAIPKHNSIRWSKDRLRR